MRERHRRERAVAVSLGKRYPQFASLRLEFKYEDAGPFTPSPQVSELHPPASAYFAFPCPYDDCDGDFDLTTAIEAMSVAGQRQCSGHVKCTGHRSVDKGKSDCDLTLRFSVVARTE